MATTRERRKKRGNVQRELERANATSSPRDDAWQGVHASLQAPDVEVCNTINVAEASCENTGRRRGG